MAGKVEEKSSVLRYESKNGVLRPANVKVMKWDDAVFAMAQADCRHDTTGGCRNCSGNEACGLCLADEGYWDRAERMLKALFKGVKK